MNPKKLLIVGDFISGSGLTQFIFNVFSNFDKNDYHIQCIGYGIDKKREINNRCKINGWQLDRVIPVTKNPLKHILWWRKFFKENDFDFVYFNYSSSWNYMPIKLARRYTHAKIVCHSHNSYYSHTFNNNFLMKILDTLNDRGKIIFNKDSDIKIATSEDAAIWMFDTLKEVSVINNGLDLKKYRFDEKARAILRKQLDVSSDEKLVGFAGVLQERKNSMLVLDIFAQYVHTYPNSTLLMIGSGPLKEKIEKRARYLNINKKLKLIDYTDKLNKWYSAMDILIFPSLYEGFGLVPLEAQVSNLPILASEYVAPQVFATENIQRIIGLNREKWVQILENTKLKNEDERKKIDVRLKKFDIKNQAREIINILEKEK